MFLSPGFPVSHTRGPKDSSCSGSVCLLFRAACCPDARRRRACQAARGQQCSCRSFASTLRCEGVVFRLQVAVWELADFLELHLTRFALCLFGLIFEPCSLAFWFRRDFYVVKPLIVQEISFQNFPFLAPLLLFSSSLSFSPALSCSTLLQTLERQASSPS